MDWKNILRDGHKAYDGPLTPGWADKAGQMAGARDREVLVHGLPGETEVQGGGKREQSSERRLSRLRQGSRFESCDLAVDHALNLTTNE